MRHMHNYVSGNGVRRPDRRPRVFHFQHPTRLVTLRMRMQPCAEHGLPVRAEHDDMVVMA
jgi:hypothetical protein